MSTLTCRACHSSILPIAELELLTFGGLALSVKRRTSFNAFDLCPHPDRKKKKWKRKRLSCKSCQHEVGITGFVANSERALLKAADLAFACEGGEFVAPVSWSKLQNDHPPALASLFTTKPEQRSQKSQKLTRAPKRKVKVCHHFKKGNCWRGSACKFSHSTSSDSLARRGASPMESAVLPKACPNCQSQTRTQFCGSCGARVDSPPKADKKVLQKVQDVREHKRSRAAFVSDRAVYWTLSNQHTFRNVRNMRNFVFGLINMPDPAEVLACLNDPEWNRHGLKCILQICTHPSISCHAGTQASQLSFQRVLVPLVQLIISLSNSGLSDLVNPLFATLHNADSFNATIQERLQDMMGINSVADLNYTSLHRASDLRYFSQKARGDDTEARVQIWEPSGWTDVLEPFLIYAREIMHRFQAARFEPKFQAFVSFLHKCTTHFAQQPSDEKDEKDEKQYSTVTTRRLIKLSTQLRETMARFEAQQKRSIRIRERIQHRHLTNSLRSGSRRTKESTLSIQFEAYDGPGELSLAGHKRHDNDFEDISRISILPTRDEILSDSGSFLPRNKQGSFHHLPLSLARLCDIHFRLLRHDLISPLRESVLSLRQAGGPEGIKGGRTGTFIPKPHKGVASERLWMFRNVHIEGVVMNRYTGVSYQLSFDNPPHLNGKKAEERRSFWKRTKRLSNNSLICLWSSNGFHAQQSPHLIFGTVSNRGMSDLVRTHIGADGVVTYHRPTINILCMGKQRALGRDLSRARFRDWSRASADEEIILLQSSSSYFAYEPFLVALQGLSSKANFPFDQILCSTASDRKEAHSLPRAEANVTTPTTTTTAAHVDLPSYITEATRYDLSCLLSPETSITEDAKRKVSDVPISDPDRFPTQEILAHSTLDECQLDAVVAALTKEVALIQGPPGTGKTYLGIKIVEALLSNTTTQPTQAMGRHRVFRNHDDSPDKPSIGPILCVCFSNHALDQFLQGIVAAGTTNIVRIGGRSKCESLDAFNLVNLRRNSANDSKSARARGFLTYKAHKCMEELEESIEVQEELLATMLKRDLSSWEELKDILELQHSVVFDAIDVPEEMDGWQTQRNKPSARWKEWLRGRPNPDRKHQPIHQGVRDTHVLMDMISDEITSIWQCSVEERHALCRLWKEQILESINVKLNQLCKHYDKAVYNLKRIHENADLDLLRNAKVIGMTTHGAAKYQHLLDTLCPSIVLVEEAAEVLEAHVLTSLSPSTKHLILIGDHEQLRPKTEVYTLSLESGKGYDLDLSLFERLVSQQACYSLATQRRMRPEVSQLIRETIYPQLKDHPTMKEYPPVKGMGENVYFWTHSTPEDSAASESKSKTNAYEVQMVVGLTQYLLMQGYRGGDITILTPYVGQLLNLRSQLAAVTMTFVDERDMEQLQDVEERNEMKEERERDLVVAPHTLQGHPDVSVEKCALKDRVRMATIDNFQGEESKVIIISLVRHNPQGRIGFLRTNNRVNVLLSRAMHGMYILGYDTIYKTPMWNRVKNILNERKCLGNKLPLCCERHGTTTLITEVSEFQSLVSDGGCSRTCEERLPCGHVCPRRCHPDDRKHVTTPCLQPCQRLRPRSVCPLQHPCPKPCGQDCGHCIVTIQRVTLSCGHYATNVPCHRAQNPEQLRCTVKDHKEKPGCGHIIKMQCGDVPAQVFCTAQCNQRLECGHICKSKCGKCTKTRSKLEGEVCDINTKAIESESESAAARCVSTEHSHGATESKDGSRDVHARCTKICGNTLFCGHVCGERCHLPGACPPCTKRCTIQCEHASCSSSCSEPCVPCAEPCSWTCEHVGRCNMPCGFPCDRLPCDERCQLRMDCGHQCPSLCGETCPSSRYCPECLSQPSSPVPNIPNNPNMPNNNKPKTDQKTYCRFKQQTSEHQQNTHQKTHQTTHQQTQQKMRQRKHGLNGPNEKRHDFDVRSQVVDLIMQTSFEDHDVDESPLLVLKCGHVFCVETLDGIFGLTSDEDKVYERDEKDEKWVRPLPLSATMQKTKQCPSCRHPITHIRRYGRVTNSLQVAQSQRTFVLHHSSRLSQLDTDLDLLFRQSQQEVCTPDDTTRLRHAFVRLYDSVAFMRATLEEPPTLKAHNACHVAIQRIHEFDDNSDIKVPRAIKQLLGIYTPDRTLELTAMLQMATLMHLRMVLLVTCSRVEQRKPNTHNQRSQGTETQHEKNGIIKHKLSQHSNQLRLLPTTTTTEQDQRTAVQNSFVHGAAILADVLELTLKQHLMPRYATAQFALWDLRLACLQCQLGVSQHITDTLKRTLQGGLRSLMADVKNDRLMDVMDTAATQNAQMARKARKAELLTRGEDLARKIRHSGGLSVDEKRMIFRAFPNAQGRGYNNSGHWNTCPRGHVYVITECGGAMQESTCPECGARIGGGSHALRSDNKVAEEFLRDATS